MTEQLSILIGDDHELVRDAIANMLQAEPDFRVRGAKDRSAVLSEIRAASGFDIILLDVNMPGMNGLEGVESVITENKDGAVVIFSGHVDDDFVWKAIELGAKGYVPKTLPIRSLCSTIRVIASGQIFIPMVKRPETRATEPGHNLNDRERSILRKLPQGMTNKEIARVEGITEVMVKMHMRSICSKLNAKNRTHAAMIARQMLIA